LSLPITSHPVTIDRSLTNLVLQPKVDYTTLTDQTKDEAIKKSALSGIAWHHELTG